jgi:(S)-ureidoglycine aminohydrolase
MRTPDQLVHSRARVQLRHALMPLEGIPVSRMPLFPNSEVRVLASPALGARFIQYLIDMPAGATGHFMQDRDIETFYCVLFGSGDAGGHKLSTGSFALIPPIMEVRLSAAEPMRVLVLRKRFEKAAGIEIYPPLYGQESEIKKEIWADNPHSLLQTLIPDDFNHDLAVNIFTFDPGFGLPVVETHVMEHGLFFLQGKGLYFLEDTWMEVKQDDFIWMGPYCPQSFCATGPTPARYIYYKNVNREIAL